VWFKLDAGTQEDIARINGVTSDPRPTPAGWRCARPVPDLGADLHVPLGRQAPAGDDRCLPALLEQAGRRLKGVLLYGLARPSLQPEAGHLQRSAPTNSKRSPQAKEKG
jgi:hypothetical protein